MFTDFQPKLQICCSKLEISPSLLNEPISRGCLFKPISGSVTAVKISIICLVYYKRTVQFHCFILALTELYIPR